MSLDASEVLARAAEWIWVPPGARELQTPEYRVIALPEWFPDNTEAMPVVFDSNRPVEQVLADVHDAAGALGRDEVVVMGLRDGTRPLGLEAHVVDRGGVLIETLSVLARPLTGLADLEVPADVEVVEVDDLATIRDWDRISVEVFGGSPRTEDELAASLGEEGRNPMLVAYRDGVALGTGGYTVAGDVLRLWSGGVLDVARGTGAYRALLDARLVAGAETGCRMALVKGRVETSAPILRRAGFEVYGEERAYRVSAT